MNIKVTMGGSQEDARALHFSYWTIFGLGHQKTIALFYPSSNVLRIHPGYAKILDKMLNALRKYRATEHTHFEPIRVEYW